MERNCLFKKFIGNKKEFFFHFNPMCEFLQIQSRKGHRKPSTRFFIPFFRKSSHILVFKKSHILKDSGSVFKDRITIFNELFRQPTVRRNKYHLSNKSVAKSEIENSKRFIFQSPFFREFYVSPEHFEIHPGNRRIPKDTFKAILI